MSADLCPQNLYKNVNDSVAMLLISYFWLQNTSIHFICNPYNFFCYECRCVQNVVNIVCLTHDMLQSVIVSGAVIYHISNINGVLKYTRITSLYNTSVMFLAAQNNYSQGQICLSPILRLSSRNRFQLCKWCHLSDVMAT